MDNKIRVYKVSGLGYMAKFEGPHKAEIEELFKTDTIPTAFTENASTDLVLIKLRELNPNTEVYYTLE